MFKIWRAGERAAPFGPRHHLARTRGGSNISTWPLARAASPAHRLPPFTFLEEHLTGSQPCVSVRDARGRTWRVKWGHEVQVETLATRLAWAAGYFVETTYYVRAGAHRRIAGTLQRAAQ